MNDSHLPSHDEVAAWSASMSDAYIQCRDWGHQWKPFRAMWDTDERCYVRILRCARCHTEREQLIETDGSTKRNRYSYSDGYQAPKGFGRLDSDLRSTLRLESTLRLVGERENVRPMRRRGA